jgi:hypothetical protein
MWHVKLFRLDLDWVWVSCWRARQFTFSRGDIVVFVSPKVTAVEFDFHAGLRTS